MSGAAVVQFLAELRTRRVQVFVRDGRLRVRAPRGSVSASDRETLRNMKSEFLAHLIERERDTPEPSFDGFATQDRTAQRCRACHGSRFWLSIHGATVCGKCHPPATDDLVARWIDGDDGAPS